MIRIAGTRAAAGAVAAALVWVVAGTGAAHAATVTEVGWWSRNPLSSAPEGGFAVGAAPDGPTAVAAIRVDLGGGVDTLVLDVVPTADAGALGSLEVCVAPDTWAAAAPGPFDDAPTTACEGDAVPFGPVRDRWIADASSLVQGRSGPTSLAVVPVAGSGTVPFEVVFEAPSVVATGATPASADGADGGPRPSLGGASGPPVTTAPVAPPVVRTSPAPAPAPIALGGPASGSAPPTAAAPAPAEPEAPAVADDDASSTIELANAGLLDDVTSEPRWGEALVLVLIGAGVGAVTYGTSRFAASRT